MPKKIIIDANGAALAGDAVAAGVRIEFEDGSKQEILLSQLSPATLARAAAHGVSQKAGDSYAGAKDEPDPKAFSIAAVADVFKNLLAGDWRAATIGSGGSRVSDFARAVAAISGKPLDEVVATLAEMTEEQQKPIRDNAAVKARLAEIKAENAIKRATAAAEKAKASGATLAF